MTEVKALRIPKVSLDFAEHLNKVFSPKDITPQTGLAEIMYQAGQRSVVEYVNRVVTNTEIKSDIADINPAITQTSFISRLYKLLNI